MLVTFADALVSVAKGSRLALEHFHPESTAICSRCSQRPKRDSKGRGGGGGQERVAGTRTGIERVIRLS